MREKEVIVECARCGTMYVTLIGNWGKPMGLCPGCGNEIAKLITPVNNTEASDES